MRIAQLAPLYEAVPPRAYGGTELAVHLLTENLVRRGHDVTLFASGDSRTSARLVSATPYAIWSEQGRRRWPTEADAIAEEARHARACMRRAGEFDVVHNHAGPAGMMAATATGTPVLTTHHRAYDPRSAWVYGVYPGAHHALSGAASETFPARGRVAPIHHGIDVASYPFSERPEGYLLFLGRVAPEKGAHVAVEVARRARRRLVIAGPIQGRHAGYGAAILAAADGTAIRYLGEAGPNEKRRLLAGASAVLFPITWDEPFGLVMVEALACGTPVLAFASGSVPEVIRGGETGFIVDAGPDPLAPGAGADRLVEAVRLLPLISRERCRWEAEARFSIEREVDEYERVYAALVSGEAPVACRREPIAVVDGELVGEPGAPELVCD